MRHARVSGEDGRAVVRRAGGLRLTGIVARLLCSDDSDAAVDGCVQIFRRVFSLRGAEPVGSVQPAVSLLCRVALMSRVSAKIVQLLLDRWCRFSVSATLLARPIAQWRFRAVSRLR